MASRIGRRKFLATLGGAAAAWPLAARAQQGERLRRIGFLRASPPPERELQAFVQGLAEQGLVQGRNFVLVAKWGDGTVARLPELAVELVNSGVDLIVTDGGSTTRVVHALTSAIPIVMASSADPFTVAGVQSLSRPGGNVTGLTSLAASISGKVLEIFKELIPGLSNLAIVASRLVWDIFASSQSEPAKMLGIKLSYFDLPGPEAINMTLDQAKAAGAEGAVLRGTPFFSLTQIRIIVEAAALHRLPRDVRDSRIHPRGRVVELRCRSGIPLSPGCKLCDENSRRRKSRRASHRTTHEIRIGDQSENR
jgi:ABC transporter substrate binding protein